MDSQIWSEQVVRWAKSVKQCQMVTFVSTTRLSLIFLWGLPKSFCLSTDIYLEVSQVPHIICSECEKYKTWPLCSSLKWEDSSVWPWRCPLLPTSAFNDSRLLSPHGSVKLLVSLSNPNLQIAYNLVQRLNKVEEAQKLTLTELLQVSPTLTLPVEESCVL